MQLNVSAESLSGASAVHPLGSWAAREEARKFWDYRVCDECVYFAKSLDVNGEGPHIFAEKYVRNDLWFHIRWAQVETGQAGDHRNEALIEVIHVDETLRVPAKLNGPVSAVDRDSSMLVEVPQFVELPEFMRVYGIRSVVRLKRIQRAMDAEIEQGPFLPVSVVGLTDWKHDFVSDLFTSRNSAGKKVDQVPSQLVERSAKVVNEISDSESDFFVGRARRGDYETVLRAIRIIFFADGVRVAFDPISKLLLSRLEVKVSPSGFHIDVLN